MLEKIAQDCKALNSLEVAEKRGFWEKTLPILGNRLSEERNLGLHIEAFKIVDIRLSPEALVRKPTQENEIRKKETDEGNVDKVRFSAYYPPNALIRSRFPDDREALPALVRQLLEENAALKADVAELKARLAFKEIWERPPEHAKVTGYCCYLWQR